MSLYYSHSGIEIYLGNCIEIIDSIKADVMITDPPYGMAYRSGWSGASVANDGDTSVRDLVLSSWKPRPAVVFGRWSVARPEGVRFLLIWDKGDWPGMGDLGLPWGPSTEEIYIIGYGFSGPRSGQILRDPRRPSGRSMHPTEKPIGLMESIIDKCPTGTIVDPFMGSGSTLVAAKNLGRKAIGIEMEEKYCEVAAKRLSQETLPFAG